ncbi:MAG: N-formylglutamate amidohydrolase [Alphaproteobacteria bacterium]|nr:N-formylglutamate amidohydrolase [Alphaproteobacteria bacterium]
MPAKERAAIEAELDPPFRVARPAAQTAPFVFCSPHSGRTYPQYFLDQSRLDATQLRKSEDAFVDELYDCAPAFGAPLIAANFPRAYLDVNREPFELDPDLFAEPLPDFANMHSIRVAGGLGTIARVVADGEEIYEHRLRFGAALERIERLYRPFHEALESLLAETRNQFGFAILIDCHSMPSNLMTHNVSMRPDFVIGDRFGAACDPRLTNLVSEYVSDLGYEVFLNRPYAGGYITEHYGRPKSGIHALQLELNRCLYLDEPRIEKTDGFDAVRTDIAHIVGRLIEAAPRQLVPRAAAE